LSGEQSSPATGFTTGWDEELHMKNHLFELATVLIVAALVLSSTAKPQTEPGGTVVLRPSTRSAPAGIK